LITSYDLHLQIIIERIAFEQMDPLTITTTCISVVGRIGKASVAIASFVHQYREAQQDMEAIHHELGSLKFVLQIISEDTSGGKEQGLRPRLIKQIRGMLTDCDDVLIQIIQELSKYSEGGAVGKSQWVLSGREDMNKLRSTLAA
jgi:hypothetical protein